MRLAIAVLLLVGCAVGQNAVKPSPPFFRGPVPTMTSTTVDVPAKQSHEITMDRLNLCADLFHHYSSTDGNTTEYELCIHKPECEDPDRILIGHDGHGQYFCHLPQVQP